MKAYQAKDIRNIALVGHNSVGKTILAESIAFNTGKISRMGTIDDGTTISDYSVPEIEKQYSIRSTLLAIDNNDTKYNIIDCPGYADFVGETYGAVEVADSVLIVASAASTQGTEVGTETGFEVAKKQSKPVAFFLNKCDYDNADYEKVTQTRKQP